jgi:hypothetical protein
MNKSFGLPSFFCRFSGSSRLSGENTFWSPLVFRRLLLLFGGAATIFPAHPAFSFCGIAPSEQVSANKFVAFLAVPLGGVYRRWANAPQNVFSACHSLKMIWVDACAVPTQMIYVQTRWYFLSEIFITESVSEALFPVDKKRRVPG